MHILNAKQFSPEQLEALFVRADELRHQATNPFNRKAMAQTFNGKQLCSLFYQPSTRTRLSFETAAAKLGLSVISTENALESSSAVKSESLEDTIKVLNEYHYDIIVLRHPETGSAVRASKVSRTPIINAGDGQGEHPTQALLDLYTIRQQTGRLNKLTLCPLRN
jgi:aspartate carbamoyltransferase catalytic subunit